MEILALLVSLQILLFLFGFVTSLFPGQSYNPGLWNLGLDYFYSYFISLILSLPCNNNWETSRLTLLEYCIHHITLLATTLNPCWHLCYLILFPTTCNTVARVPVLSSPCLLPIPELISALACYRRSFLCFVKIRSVLQVVTQILFP